MDSRELKWHPTNVWEQCYADIAEIPKEPGVARVTSYTMEDGTVLYLAEHDEKLYHLINENGLFYLEWITAC